MRKRSAAILSALAVLQLVTPGLLACSGRKPPPAPFVSHIPFLGLDCGQVTEAEAENLAQLAETRAALAAAEEEECSVTVGDVLIWGFLAGVTNDDDVCRELEIEVSRLVATAEAINTAQTENGCHQGRLFVLEARQSST